MTGSAQASQFPATLLDWERVLTRGLLHSDGANSDPIRSFEITPETLAQHCGLGPDYASAAEDAFRRALKSYPYLHSALQGGTATASTTQVPNCMSLLSLSLLVDSLLDGTYEGGGQYRQKLAQWLGIPRSFMNLSGISAMWLKLVAWLDARIAAGEHFRSLILPDPPKSWTHIGYTRYLSFPTRRDVALLRKLVEHKPRAAEDASTLVLLLDPLVNSSSVSYGMQSAFQDFRRALRAGEASTDHRFWRLVVRARLLSGHAENPSAQLRMEFDEDGVRHYHVSIAGSPNVHRPANLGDATQIGLLQASSTLGPAVKRGVLFFRSSGLATWTGSAEPPVGIGPFHVALSDRNLRLPNGALPSFERSGSWQVTSEPVSAFTLEDILNRLGLRAAKMALRTIALADGVRVGKAWLGHPRFLPVINGADGDPKVTDASGSVAELSCVNGALIASGPVDGDFIISEKTGRWLRRASFVTLATLHAEMDGAAYRLPEQEEWLARPGSCVRVRAGEPGWDEETYVHQDMLEAIYASARSGLSEGDLVGLVDRVAGSRTWDILRTLQESTFLEARLRERWRGRTFTLGRPTLFETEFDGEPGVVVSGAVPYRMEADFRDTVVLNGGRPFRRLRTGSFAPPLLGAAGVSPPTLSNALGWRVLQKQALPSGSASSSLVDTPVLGEGHAVASKWDWFAGRFRVGDVVAGPVSLVRLAHAGGRDHDIYRVTGARCRSFNSRHAAIIDAYLQAGKPLFKWQEDRLIRISAEGALPLEIAKALRIRGLANGGASMAGWEYWAGRCDLDWLCNLLPGIIEGARSMATDPEMSYRRGRGARRPLWTTGGNCV